MADDADVLDRLSGVDVHVLASVIGQPTAEQRVRLIEFLGPQRYARLRDLALRRGTSARPERGLGNVVLIPGILGSELARLNSAGERRTIWPRASELAAGGMMTLRLGRDGRAGPTASGAIYARGIVTRHYGELLLTLAERWNVRAFWYDWRKDVRIAASELETRLREWFPDGAPVHLIGHGMGGLVARRFTLAYPERWAMASVPAAQRGRLILLGTPNRGVPAAAQVLAGIDPIVYKLSALDVGHSHDELREVLATFPSLHQLLPAPELAERIYDATTWGDLNISQSFLDLAKAHHAQSASVAGDDRTIVVAGGGSPTVTGLPPGDLDKPAHYRVTCAGDGHVPIASARLDGSGATYFVDAGHADLLTDRAVLRALPDLLEFGRTDLLGTEPPDAAGGADPAAAYDGARDREVLAVKELVSRQARRGEFRGSRHLGRGQERDVEDLLVRGVIASTVSAADETAAAAAHADRAGEAEITVTVVQGAIEQVHKLAKGIDATAVGHYVDVPPQAAEAAIDAAISNLRDGEEVPETERVINSLTNRGVLGGRLGEVFLLPDPRGKREALIALAGMGEPGRFGVPELTVLARELCWTLGRLRKHRLATVLIGSGNGNLTIEESVDGWLRGVRAAVQTAPAREGEELEEITFVEADPRKIARIHTALADWCQRTDGGIRYRSPSREAERQIRELAYARDKEELDELWAQARRASGDNGVPQPVDTDPVPTRVSLSLEGNAYRYGAISADASVPERVVPLDPELVRDASAEVTTERLLVRQMERGEFLGKLLLPRDLAAHLDGNAPIVMLLDANTARINWEMVATGLAAPGATQDAFNAEEEVALDRFLGTSRGFTRQLRSRLAPPPDPPPPPRRVLKVLVIADPAEDHPLLGAQEEGQAVADLFASFNRVWGDRSPHRVAVTALFGHEATRTNVLRHLISERYDVLHYAGHCVFDPASPARSGWVFTGGKRLSVFELSRVDRVPKFVFSNACESGVTADDAAAATSDLAPGFAQAFFARGVSNFICTAWPVNDRAALDFARELYRLLLALPGGDDQEPPPRAAALHQAMRLARRKIARTPSGRLTWGAYQHYGNPHFRLFDWLGDTGPSANGITPEAEEKEAEAEEPSADPVPVASDGL